MVTVSENSQYLEPNPTDLPLGLRVQNLRKVGSSARSPLPGVLLRVIPVCVCVL